MKINKNLKLITTLGNTKVYIHKNANFLYYTDFNQLEDGSDLCVSAVFQELNPDVVKLLVGYLELNKKIEESGKYDYNDFKKFKLEDFEKINENSRFVIEQYQKNGYLDNVEVRKPNDWKDLPKFIQEYIKLEKAYILSTVKMDQDIYKYVIYFIQDGYLKIVNFIVYSIYENDIKEDHLYKQTIATINPEIAIETIQLFLDNMEETPGDLDISYA